jgi:hypothetical protein
MDTQKPALQLFCLCDDIGRVEGTSKVILIGVFEQIQVEELPVQHPKLWVFARWGTGVGTFSARTQIVDPEGEVVFQTEEIPFTLEMVEQSHNVSGQLLGLPLESAGTYWVEAFLDEELEGRIPLVVEVVGRTPESGGSAEEPVFH